MPTSPTAQRPEKPAVAVLRKRLSSHVLARVACLSGCSYTTVHRIAAGHTDNVYTDTVDRLNAAMDHIETTQRES